jgi:anti-sigma B factor antagonist
VLLEVIVEKTLQAEAIWLISLAGELDFESAPRFRQALVNATPPKGEDVVLDLSELGFLDSSGLASVVDLYLRLNGAGAGLAVVSNREHINRMFRVTSVDRFLPIAPTREQAIEALAA